MSTVAMPQLNSAGNIYINTHSRTHLRDAGMAVDQFIINIMFYIYIYIILLFKIEEKEITILWKNVKRNWLLYEIIHLGRCK